MYNLKTQTTNSAVMARRKGGGLWGIGGGRQRERGMGTSVIVSTVKLKN